MDNNTYSEIIELIHTIDKRTAVMNTTLESLSREQEDMKLYMKERLQDIDLRVRSLENWRVYTIAGAAALYFVADKILPFLLGVFENGKP